MDFCFSPRQRLQKVFGRSLRTHCVSKKRPTFKLSLTLSYLNRFSKFLHCWKAYEIGYKNHMTVDNTHLTLGMLLHYLGKLNIQIFCRYPADTEENAICSHFLPYLPNICRKFECLISQGNAATCLR